VKSGPGFPLSNDALPRLRGTELRHAFGEASLFGDGKECEEIVEVATLHS